MAAAQLNNTQRHLNAQWNKKICILTHQLSILEKITFARFCFSNVTVLLMVTHYRKYKTTNENDTLDQPSSFSGGLECENTLRMRE